MDESKFKLSGPEDQREVYYRANEEFISDYFVSRVKHLVF